MFPKQTEDQPKQFDREHILVFFSENLGFFQFVSVCLGLFRLLCFYTKQRVSMFWLNRNKQKTNRNSFIESIFCYFSENLGLFRLVSKQFCLFQLFWYRLETPKQTEIFCCWFHKTNRNRSCYSLFRFEPKFFYLLPEDPTLSPCSTEKVLLRTEMMEEQWVGINCPNYSNYGQLNKQLLSMPSDSEVPVFACKSSITICSEHEMWQKQKATKTYFQYKSTTTQ